jgi:predicted MFS family arabinose efflux permease
MRPLFLPSPRQALWLAAVALAALGCGFYLRYGMIEQPTIGIACESGTRSLLCSVRKLVIALFFLPETKPASAPGAKQETVSQTFAGYGKVFKDVPFIAFIVMSVMTALIYTNFNTTLGVFLRDVHGIPEIGYGYLISMNAVIVVLFQFWVARKLEKFKPMLMVALGTALYGFGFAMYGFTSTYIMFAVAMIVITIGEMVVSPFQQALVASFAPEAMRGRYMAVSGLSWGMAFAIGPYFAVLLLDSASPNLLWVACGILGVVTTVGYVILDKIHHSPAPILTEPSAAD